LWKTVMARFSERYRPGLTRSGACIVGFSQGGMIARPAAVITQAVAFNWALDETR
jgi:predicted esterase